MSVTTERNAQPNNIVLGEGVFSIDGEQVGLTRDGGNFSIEYTYREIKADGDKGLVKGRVSKDETRPKLTISHLEILTKLDKMHPGIKVTTEDSKTTIAGAALDEENDYHIVVFKGQTKDGKDVTITLKNAINLENISWDLKDKDEIIDSVTFQAAFEENSDVEPWSVEYAN